MDIGSATGIAHPIGFLTGSVVYALLLAMVLQKADGARFCGRSGEGPWYQRIRPPLYIASLGLLWNLASLAALIMVERPGVAEPTLLVLLATTALGSLPAVVLHSVWQTTDGAVRRIVAGLTVAGYGLSVAAAVWNTLAIFSDDSIPASGVWWLLTIGYLVLFVVLLGASKRTLVGHRGVVLVFLAVCSIVALPLSHHPDDSLPWWFDFIGHHASLPVAVAVLYRDYRFAFIDHFIKRALSFLLLVGVSFALYVTVVFPVLQSTDEPPISSARSGLVVSLWALMALSYPWLYRSVTWLFDTRVLRRQDYQDVRRGLLQRVSQRDTAESVLDELGQTLERTLRSKAVGWSRIDGALRSLTDTEMLVRPPIYGQEDLAGPIQTVEGGLSIVIPTAELPRYVLAIAAPVDGRRLLSEDLVLVNAAALIAARRIDALRTSHERCELALREQEMQKLATEAELRALRAQINPHFLFNALNTIGYLIEVAPERATNTLKDLTSLLRGILRRMNGNFATLGEEMDLIRSYLDIEQARFEERLRVHIDVPEHVMTYQVPPLVLQPIVENAVKHGIQPALGGGEITIVARVGPDLRSHSAGNQLLSLAVRDTGVGVTEGQLRQGRRGGIGLANVERRLRCHYGERADLSFVSTPGSGTTVELRLPAHEAETPSAIQAVDASAKSDQ